MANWTAKFGEAARPDLERGERVRAAVFVVPAATSMTATTLSAVGRGGPIAASMPIAASVLGLTDRRLLVYGHSSLADKPKDLRFELPLDRLRSVDVEERSATCRFVLRFGDGSSSVYEAPRIVNDAASFAAAAELQPA